LEVASGSAINRLSSLETASGSAITRLGALETASGSAISRLNSIESTTGSLNVASGSAITRLDALEVASGSAINRLSSLETASGSAISRLNSLEVTSGSNITRLTNLENKTGSYATTGSNTFVGGQYFSSSFNPTGFTTTASLYTDGGLRVTKDAYISGTLYLNNVTVFGTQSVAYISSSQLNIGTNIITVNTDTPSVRFGGLAVYDSGSTGLTGSMLWDSQANHWVYSNPSGSSYSGGMFISGPRTSTLGSETGTSACMLLAGQGGDHLTSSMIYHSSTATCFHGNSYINSSGLACFADTVCANTFKSKNLIVCEGSSNSLIASNNNEVLRIQGFCSAGMFASFMSGSTVLGDIGNTKQAFSSGNADGFGVNARDSRTLELGTANTSRLAIAATGESCFSCQVCAPSFISSGTSCFSGCVNIFTGNQIRLYNSAKNNWVQIESPLVSGDAAIDFKLTTQSGILYINNTGITCFNNTVCTPALVINKSNPVLYINACNNEISTIGFTQGAVTGYGGFIKVSTGLGDRAMTFGLSAAGTNNDATELVRLDDSGVTCFSSSVCAPTMIINNCINIGTTVSLGSRLSIESANDQAGITMFNTFDCNKWSLRTSTPNVSNKGFAIVDDICNATRIQIDGAGNIGIGVAAPNNILTLYSASSAIYTQWVQSGTGTSSTDGLRIGLDASSNGIINLNEGTALITSIDGTERLRITSTGIACFACQVCIPIVLASGCIGIGTTDLSNGKLNIGGNTDINVDAGTVGMRFRRIATVGYLGTGDWAVNGLGNYDFGISSGYCSGALVLGTSAGIERMRIVSAGITCFACQVCAPQYITTQGSSVSYADGSNYLVWNSEGEYCSLDNQTNCTLTTMKTWIADRTGCVRLKFAGYISSGPTYWGWRIYRNNSTAYTCQSYAGCLETGCSANVHGYTTFSVGIGPINPGDCITLQMVSTGGGSTPAPGQNQYLFAKEFRIYSTTPNFSAGSPSNIFGDRLGVGTCTPNQTLHLYTNFAQSSGVGSAIQFTSDGAGGDNGWIGVAKGTGNGLELSVENRDIIFNTKSTTPFGGCERMRITCGGNVGIGTSTPARIFTIFNGASTSRIILQNTATGQAINNGLDITMDGTDAQFWNYQNGSIQLATNNTERIRITNTGVLGFNGSSGPANASVDKMSMGYLNSGYGWIQTWNGTPLVLNREGNNVGINTCAPNEKLTVWTSSSTGLQTALRLNNPFGFNNLNTGAQIVFSQDRSVAEDLKQGIIAVGQADAGTSATSFMAFYTNNTGLGERLRITSTGVACFSSTVCAPMASISGCIGIGTNPATYTLKAAGRGYFFATNQDAGWGMLTLDYGNGVNGNIYAIQMAEGGATNAAVGYGSYASSNCGDLVMWTNDGGGLVERSRMYSNGAARIATMNANSTTVLQKSFSVAAGACVNVCFDIFNDIPGKGSGYVFQADIHVGGYGSAGASALLYKASVAGYDGHHVGIGSYHKDAELVKCASGVDVKIYNPPGCSCLLGVTIYNCSGTYVHVGTLRMVLTY
jgi:hypothetical protein